MCSAPGHVAPMVRPLGAGRPDGSMIPRRPRPSLRRWPRTHEALPAMLAVAITLHDNHEIREEDYAAAYMGIQNLSLVAQTMGLGTHIRTGAVMDDPAARAAVGLPDGERIVATVHVGEPESQPEGKARRPATELTTWVP